MKKFTLSLFMMIFTICGAYAQLAFESFEVWPAPGWAIYNDVTDAPQSTVTWVQSAGSGAQAGCNGTYAAFLQRENLLPPNGRPIDWLISPAFTVPTNPILKFCTKLTVQAGQGNEFDIRISENPTQLAYGNYVSLIDGSTGTFPLSEAQLMENGDQLQYLNKIITIPNSYIGKTCYIAFVMKGVTNQGDRWLIDAVSVDKRCDKPTPANPVFTNPTTVGATFQWVNPSGATSHEIEVVPVAASPTGTGYVVNATTSVVWPAGGAPNLTPATAYKYYVRSLCSPTNPSEWAGPFNFSTVPLGARCGEPLPINNLPFQTSNNTVNFGDFVDGTPGTSCNAGATALNGNEVIYKYTATFTGLININLTNNGLNSTMFVYTSCDNIGATCAAGGTGSNAPINLNNFSVTTGQDYYIVISTSGSTQTTPYTLIVQAASCTPPTSTPPTTGIGPNSATLSWDPVATGIVEWQIVVQPQGSGIPQSTGMTTDNNTAYLADGLQEATPYEYWIRNNCNNGTFSAWAGPYLFSTTQVPAILNYSQDFETLPSGFSFISGTQPNKWVVGNATSNGGTNALYISNDNGVTNAYTETTTSIVHAYRDIQIPAVLGASNEISVAFDLKGIGDANDYLRVWLVPTNYTIPATGITALANQRIKLGPDYFNNTAWTNIEYTQNVQPFAGQIMRLVFEWRNNATVGNQPPAAIDNLKINLVTCARPSGLTATNPTQNGITLAWVAPASGAESYDYYYSTSPVPPTDATPQNGNTANLTATPNDLQDASTYYVWVRSVCSGTNGKSLWVGPVSFATTQIPATLNYSQDFEGVSSFQFINGTGANNWVIGTATSNGGTKSLYVSNDNGVTNAYSNTNTAIHAYRDIQLPATVNEISVAFDWKGAGDANDYFRVWLVPVTFTPTANTGISAVLNDRIKLGPDYFGSTNWTNAEFTQDVSQFAGQVRRLVIEWRNNTSVNVPPPAAIDNLTIKIVTCSKPSGLTATNPTPSSVNLAWVAPPSGAASYDYYYSSSNTPPTEATLENGNTTNLFANPTDLQQSTTYYVWVRSVCSGTNGKSLWFGPVSFTTPQIPAPIPYTEDFQGTNHNYTFVNGNFENKWHVGNAVGNNSTRSLYISNDNGVSNAYTTAGSNGGVFAYRDFQLPANITSNQIEVSFDFKGNGEGTTTLYDYMRVWIVPIDYYPTAGTAITTGNGRQQVGGTYNLTPNWTTAINTINVSTYQGQARRIIFEWRNDGSGGSQPPMAVDNVNIAAITCPKPINLAAPVASITTTSAVLNWQEVGTATTWYIYVAPVGSAAPTSATPGTLVPGTSPTYLAPNLTPGTPHFFYVRSDCGSTDGLSSWAGPFQFITKPSNDECSTALVVPVNSDSLCNQTVLGTLFSATASPQANSCTGTADDDDVWFEFTPAGTPGTQYYIALLDIIGENGLRVSEDDMIFAVYSGTCGNLTQILCSANNNALLPTSVVAGQTYKLRVYSSGTTARSWTFRVCIGEVYKCDNATRFCNEETGPTVTFQGSVGVPSLGARQCLLTTPNPTFFELLVQQSGPISFNITQTSITGELVDVDYIAYGPFDGPAGTAQSGCGSGLVPANQIACGYSTAAIENFNIPNAIAGKYYVIIITNYDGDRSTISFSQTNTTTPGAGVPSCEGICDVALGPDVTLCGATQHTLTATIFNALGYTWYFNDGTGEVQIPNATSSTYVATQSGTYRVLVDKPSCGTPPTDSINIVFGPAVSLPAQINASVCGAGGTASVLLPTFNTIVLGSLDPSQYVVEYYLTQAAANAGTAPLDPAIAVTLTGQSLFVRVESAIAATCFDTAELVVNVVTAPAATISYTGSPYCSNEATGTVTQTGNVGGVYSSTTGLSINASTGAIDIAASTPGTYTVTYTIAQTATCDEFTTTAQVTIVEAPTATISYPTPLCSNGTTAQVTQTGTTGGTYTSTAGLVVDPATGEINIAASTFGTYDVTYTIAATADCAAFSAQAQVVITAAATATINYPSSPFCSNETTGTVTQTGDTGGVYTSTTGLSIDAATGAIDIAASTPGTYTVTYTIAQTATCDEFTTTAQVTIVEAPSGTISYTTPLCNNGTTAQVTQTATAGGTYTSTTGLVIDPATGEINIAASTPGTYDVTYAIAATADCAAFLTQAQVVITQIATATIDYGTGPFCSNGGVISVTQTGTTGGSYTSSTGLSINGTTGDIDLGASTAGTYTVTYTIAATGGCDPVTATASVTVTALPVAAFTYSPAIVCQNVANVAVTLGGGSTAGTFTSGPGLTIDPVTGAITPGTSTPGTYIVTNTIAAANGCPAVSDTFTVTINAAPVATFNYTASPYCKDDGTASPTLNGVAGTFSSTAGLIVNASTGQVDLAMSEPGTYTVTNTIAASTECPSFFETATITVIANPDVFVEQGCDGNNYVLEVNFDNDDVYTEDTVTFSWIDPSGNPLTQTGREVIVTATGTYNVVVTPNAAGACAVTVPVQVDNTTCMVQRGISPNNDGKNDTFNLSALDVTKISIFNRYGQEVFSYGAYTDQWHGQGKAGDELPTGTYFYSFERANGEKATGWVYINREEN